ncbi:La-related protein 1C [Sesamum angolense]|uniref:La-related protein 1C n=1 Tax=Sesamum angolense TaxID=2727404 RepID=A0AAE1XFE1_9LAMI|nr:La-related protein 1C [Sesamum angolense]
MAASFNPPSPPNQAQNSPRSRQSRRSSAARGISSPSDISPPSISLPGTAVQEQFLTSSSSTSLDSLPSKEASIIESVSSSLAEDGSAAPAGSDAQLDNNDNGGAAKRPAWNKPSNGATVEIGAVMGADSWPALSESARASPKPSSPYSLKTLPQGSITVPQDMALGSVSSPKEVSASISTPNSTSNHVVTTRQRSMKRGGGSSSHSSIPANGSLPQALPLQDAMVEGVPPNAGKSGGSVGESSRDNTHKDSGQRGGSYGGNELQPQRSSFRRNNSGPQPRGEGSYHHSHGGRRDQERGKQEWANPHRSYGNRDNHPQQRVGSRPFMRGPAPNTPFMPPPPPVPVRPFVAPMVYTEVPSAVYYVSGPHPDPLRPVHMIPFSPVYFPMPDPYLVSKIVNQIDYYFSNENLVKDTFLRQKMDSEGWVSIKLIAGFKKVMQLTDNIQLILDAIQASNIVEVQGDKVRRKSDWNKWIMPPVQTTATSPQPIHESSQNMLAAQLNNVALDEKAA